MDKVSVLIIGGGVVGCAVAWALSGKHQDIFLVERYPRLGMATSTRNSGVIHAGIHYPKNSLKAKHCLAGNRMTYEFCAANGVPHRPTGKLIVATNAHEEAELAALKARGEANGVEGIRVLDAAAIRRREPHIAGTAALEIPSSGICSAEELVKAYARVAKERAVNIVTHARVTSLEALRDSIRARVEVGESGEVQTETIAANCVVNAAGLYADEVAAMLGNHSWRIYPVRGEYCEIRGPHTSLINALVYPLPHPEALTLGVHFTKTLWGTVLVGPTATYVDDKNNYERDRLPISEFAKGAKHLLPEIQESDLQLGYSGLRPKLVAPGEKGPADFVIERDKKVPQAIHLEGIESPGLTSAPSIAKQVSEMVDEALA